MEATLEIFNLIWQLKTLLLCLILGGMFFAFIFTIILGYTVLTFRLCYDTIDSKHWYFLAREALRDNIGNTTLRWPRETEVLTWKSLLLR